MATIAGLWWLWLILVFLFTFLGFKTFLGGSRRAMNTGDVDGAISSFGKSVPIMLAAGFSWIIFLVSIGYHAIMLIKS